MLPLDSLYTGCMEVLSVEFFMQERFLSLDMVNKRDPLSTTSPTTGPGNNESGKQRGKEASVGKQGWRQTI